jgi:hypothetical protein
MDWLCWLGWYLQLLQQGYQLCEVEQPGLQELLPYGIPHSVQPDVDL